MLTLRLNGDIMQHESTDNMIFPIAQLIEYASTHMQLLPGDLLCSGSPSGNGTHHHRFLKPGDVLEGLDRFTGHAAQPLRRRRADGGSGLASALRGTRAALNHPHGCNHQSLDRTVPAPLRADSGPGESRRTRCAAAVAKHRCALPCVRPGGRVPGGGAPSKSRGGCGRRRGDGNRGRARQRLHDVILAAAVDRYRYAPRGHGRHGCRYTGAESVADAILFLGGSGPCGAHRRSPKRRHCGVVRRRSRALRAPPRRLPAASGARGPTARDAGAGTRLQGRRDLLAGQ